MNSNKIMKTPNRRFFIAALVALLTAPSPMLAYAADGVNFKSADGRLSVWAPVKPQVSEQSFPSTTGGPYN